MQASHNLQAAANPLINDGSRGSAQLAMRLPEAIQHQTFTLQGPQQPLAQGPVAPSASQLPLPRLNAHTAGLLSAFKSGMRPNQPQFNAAPSLQSPLEFPTQPRTHHQNSLLDLFRRPSGPQQSPQGQQPQASLGQQQQGARQQVLGQVPTISQPTQSQPPQPQPQPPMQRKSSALGMITRTLPKVKLEDKKPTAPVPEMSLIHISEPTRPY